MSNRIFALSTLKMFGRIIFECGYCHSTLNITKKGRYHNWIKKVSISAPVGAKDLHITRTERREKYIKGRAICTGCGLLFREKWADSDFWENPDYISVNQEEYDDDDFR